MPSRRLEGEACRAAAWKNPGMTSIVIVNGASSSGRTSLVRRFCEIHGSPWQAAHIDEFVKRPPADMWERCAGTDEGWGEIGVAFNDHLAALADHQISVIADTFYAHPSPREHLFALVGREKVFFVQLYCSLSELERRERERGDRRPGLARSQFDAVYSFGDYDLQIDSTSRSVTECAEVLLLALSAKGR